MCAAKAMGPDDSQRDDERAREQGTVPDELLDRLLDEARWPEPTAGTVERLLGQWHALTAPEAAESPGGPAFARPPALHDRNWRRWSAAAVLLVSLAGLAWWGLVARDGARLAETRGPKPVATPPAIQAPAAVDVPSTVVDPPNAAEDAVDEAPSWRPPTAYEQLLVVAHRGPEIARSTDESPPTPRQTEPRAITPQPAKQRHEQRDVAAAKPPGPKSTEQLESWLADTLAQSQENPQLDVAARWAELSAEERGRAEAMLVVRVQTTGGRSQSAAWRALATVATEQSLPILRQAATAERWKLVVLPALIRLESSQRLGQFALAQSNQDLRRQVLADLWDRDDAATWRMLFEFAAGETERADALGSLRQAEHPPVDWLCEIVLRSPRSAERAVAAELLGRLDRADVTQRLIQLTDSPGSRQAAIAGLLVSSEPSARGFLAAAEQDPYLVASIWSARRYQSDTAPTPTGEPQHGTP